MLFICFVFAFKFFPHLLLFYLSSTQTDMAAVSNKVNYLLSFSPNKMVCYYKLLIEFHKILNASLENQWWCCIYYKPHSIVTSNSGGGHSSKVWFKLKEIENMERYQNHDPNLQELWSMIMISNCAIISMKVLRLLALLWLLWLEQS